MEEFAFVLDYLPEGRPSASFRREVEPLAYVIGRDEFKLFEISIKAPAEVGEKVYIGKDQSRRTKVNRILRRIKYDELTAYAKNEMTEVLEQVVKEREPFFIKFLNNAAPITTRFHSLELLPGFGKRMMWSIIEEREKEPIKSFEDLTKRTGLKNPEKYIARRIEEEISGKEERYFLFVKNI
jgi:putative nucleotide binding protein